MGKLFNFFRPKENLDLVSASNLNEVYFAQLPESVRTRLALHEGVLYISNELNGNAYILECKSALKRSGVMQHEFIAPEEFNKRFSSQSISTAKVIGNEIQTLAIRIFKKAFEAKATDIHIKNLGSHCLLRFRIMGMLSDHDVLDADTGVKLIRGIYASMCGNADSHFVAQERQDARISNELFLPKEVYSIRVHTEATQTKTAKDGVGTCMYLRLLYDSTAATGDLGSRLKMLGFLSSQISTFQYLITRTGLSVLAGPTGHGKSTVLKHVLESMVEKYPQKSFLSIEDPVEYLINGVDQVAINTKDGEDRALNYMNSIAGAVRSDLDVFCLGEMRFPESVQGGVNAAMTGHAVWSTFHASDAFSIVLRMATLLTENGYTNALDHICEPNILSGLIYQRLIPILCPQCSKLLVETTDDEKDEEYYDPKLKDKIYGLIANPTSVRVLGNGCDQCNKRGVVGQQVAAEVVATDAVMLSLLRKGEFDNARKYWVKDRKGITHLMHALQLVEKGLADPAQTEERLGLPLDYEKGLFD